MLFKKLALSGTFDHLHLGHKYFLKQALKQAELCICGITTNWIKANKILPKTIQPFAERVKNLQIFLETNKLSRRVQIIPLNNQFGPTLKDSAIDSLAVTLDSLAGAQLVNQQRKFKGLSPLSLLMTNIVKTTDKRKISSSRVRLGEINRQGFVYGRLLPQAQTLVLPTKERQYFKQPLGQLLAGSSQSLPWAAFQVAKQIQKRPAAFIITVGDITTQACLQQQIKIDLAVVDYRSERQPLTPNFHQMLKNKADWLQIINNQPGTISLNASKLIMNFLPLMALKNKTGFMQVNGEEDLLVLPIILLAPLNTIVLYGQPNQGIILTLVTENLKEKVVKLLSKFHPS